MKPFFVLVTKMRIILLVGTEVTKKKTKKHPNKQKQTNLRLLVQFGKERGNRTVKKEKGRLRKLPKEKVEDCQQANEKGTTCSQRGLPPNHHCSPLSFSLSFSFSSKALFELQHKKEEKQLNRRQHDLPETSDSSETVCEILYK